MYTTEHRIFVSIFLHRTPKCCGDCTSRVDSPPLWGGNHETRVSPQTSKLACMYSLRRQASHSVNHPRSGNRAPDVHVKRTIDRVTRDSFGRGRLLGAVTLK